MSSTAKAMVFDGPGKPLRSGTGFGTVAEYAQMLETGGLYKIIKLVKHLFGLARKSNHQGRPDTDPAFSRTDPVYELNKHFMGPLAAHGFQQFRIHMLQR